MPTFRDLLPKKKGEVYLEGRDEPLEKYPDNEQGRKMTRKQILEEARESYKKNIKDPQNLTRKQQLFSTVKNLGGAVSGGLRNFARNSGSLSKTDLQKRRSPDMIDPLQVLHRSGSPQKQGRVDPFMYANQFTPKMNFKEINQDPFRHMKAYTQRIGTPIMPRMRKPIYKKGKHKR